MGEGLATSRIALCRPVNEYTLSCA